MIGPLIPSNLTSLTPSSPAKPRSGNFEATVVKSQPGTGGQFNLTLSDGRQTLQVSSERPLSPGTRLQLSPQSDNTLLVLQQTPPGARSAVSPLAQAISQLSSSRQQLEQLAQQNLLGRQSQASATTTTTTTTTANSSDKPLGKQHLDGLLRYSQTANSGQPSATTTSVRPAPLLSQALGVLLQLAQMKATAGSDTQQAAAAAQTTNKSGPVGTGSTASGRLSATLSQQIRETLNQLPNAARPNGDAVKHAIQHSGVLHERHLLDSLATTLQQASSKSSVSTAEQLFQASLQGSTTSRASTSGFNSSQPGTTGNNLKTLLTLALAQLGGLPTEANGHPKPLTQHLSAIINQPRLQLLQGALAQIENLQLVSRQQDNPPLLRSPLLFTLAEQIQQAEVELSREPADTRGPERDRQATYLTGEQIKQGYAEADQQHSEHREAASETPRQAAIWRLKLHFDLPDHGPLDVDIRLGWPSIHVTFWSLQQHTRQRLQPCLAPLQERLQQLGATVEQLEVRHGSLPAGEHNKINQQLVDVHT